MSILNTYALEEHALWQDLKEGDAHAFETIYKKYVQVVYNYGRKITKDEELIHDCIQDRSLHRYLEKP